MKQIKEQKSIVKHSHRKQINYYKNPNPILTELTYKRAKTLT